MLSRRTSLAEVAFDLAFGLDDLADVVELILVERCRRPWRRGLRRPW